MRLLLIEDDDTVARNIEWILRSENYNVETTDLGESGIELGKTENYGLILLDLNLPDMSGYEVLKSLRGDQVKTPVLILSALTDIRDKVKGLSLGADDYLTKPFHKNELVARVNAIMRRSKGKAESCITISDLVIRLDERAAELNGARLHLTAKEYQILEALALRKGAAVAKETLLHHLYGGRDEPEIKIIDVFVCKLRKKLAAAGRGRSYIETVKGRGFTVHDPGHGSKAA